MTRIVTLLTDFGTADGYIGEMKGVLLALARDVSVVDISHDIASHDTNGARLALARYWRRFPLGTIHVVVVDPGVGTSRAALAVESNGFRLLGPDTGVLSPALLSEGARTVQLPIPQQASNTFHGRDVFAPAAAALALGATLESLGAPHDHPIVLRTPEPRRHENGAMEGEIIHVDRFGNLITNLISRRGGVLEANGRAIPIRSTYADAERGEPVALTGSNGFLEIAVREGRASEVLALRRGQKVYLR